LRLGTNANYRLAAHPIMVRIAPGHIEDVRKEVNVARWLAGSGFPAARSETARNPVDDIACELWCLAQRYHGTPPVSFRPRRTNRDARTRSHQ